MDEEIQAFVDDNWKLYIDERLHCDQRFLVSRMGEVKSFHKGMVKPKYLKGSVNNGYRIISVRLDNGKNSARYVHNMMAETFLENVNSCKYVIHLNHKKLDNNLANLQWATFDKWKEHNKERFNLVHKSNKTWERHRKLSDTQVMRLKKKLLDPDRKSRISTIAKQFNISKSHAYRIKRGDYWKHIQIKQSSSGKDD